MNIVWFRFSGSEFMSRVLWTWRGAGQSRLIQQQSFLVFTCICCVTLFKFIEIYCLLYREKLVHVTAQQRPNQKPYSAMELLMSESVMLCFSCGYGQVAMCLQYSGCSAFINWTRGVLVVAAEKPLVLSCWKFSDFMFEKYIHSSGWTVELFS